MVIIFLCEQWQIILMVFKYKGYQGIYTSIIFFEVVLIGFILTIKLNDYLRRTIFFNQHENDRKIKWWKHIWKKRIQQPIIICAPQHKPSDAQFGSASPRKAPVAADSSQPDLQVLCINNCAYETFHIERKQEILDKLSCLYVNHQKFQHYNQFSIRDIITRKFLNAAKKVSMLCVDNVATEVPEDEKFISCKYMENSPVVHETDSHATNQQKLLQTSDPETGKYFDVKIINCEWDSHPALMIWLEDISKKVYEDRMEKLNQCRHSFLSNLSHNLNTPLNGIMLLVESANLYLQNAGPTCQRHLAPLLQGIKQNGKMLNYKIKDILDYTSIEYKKLVLTITTFSIDQLIDEIIDLYEKQMDERKISIKKKFIQCEQGILIQNDRSRLFQVLRNLTGNAIKHTQAGQITIEVRHTSQNTLSGDHILLENSEQNQLNISVNDNGISLENRAINHMHDQSSQALQQDCSPDSKKPYTKGTCPRQLR